MFSGLGENIRVALSSVWQNRVRAVLTIFIIGLGIMALVSMLTAVDGIKGALFKGFSNVGANTFTITSEDPMANMGRHGMGDKENEPINYEEARNFQKRYDVAADIAIFFDAAYDAVIKFRGLRTSPKIRVMGVDHNYLASQGADLQLGRNFTEQEVDNGRNVALIGYTLKEDIFGVDEAVGKSIRINDEPYLIIGHLEEQGSTFGESIDNQILVPVMAARYQFASGEPNYKISVQSKLAGELQRAIDEATGLFRIIRRLKLAETNDFAITKSDNLASILDQQISFLRIIAFIIGFITLAGAAVGLTNIMLVSVTERTREIGVRKAIGATANNIRNQFLWEAVVTCLTGGILGVIAGILLGNVVADYFEGEFILPWNWTIFGLVVCVIVGIIAGIYPAAKAARLDPIESLRHE